MSMAMFEKGIDESPLVIREPSEPPGSTPVERLYAELESRRISQASILAASRHAWESSTTPLGKFLLNLVAESEARHLALVDRLIGSLGDALNWTHSSKVIPDGNRTESIETVETVRRLLELEREAARSNRRLARAYAGIDDGLEQVLLQYRAEVAKSNIRLLELVLRRFQASAEETSLLVDGRKRGSSNGRYNDESIAA